MPVRITAGEKHNLIQTSLELSVTHDLPGLDISVFLLGAGRKMSGDDSIVFYNNPSSPGVQGRFTDTQAHFKLDLTQLDEVSRLMVTASHDDLILKKAGVLKAEVGGFEFNPLSGLQGEKAAMLLEIYNHKGSWKLAAVGQGFTGGLGELIRYFGGEVESGPAPAATPTPAPRPAIPALNTASRASGPATGSAGASPAGRGGSVNLLKVASGTSTISLAKGERVSLRKEDGAPDLSGSCMGLGWDAASGRSIDLDAGCLLFDSAHKHLETIFFMKLAGGGGAVRHSGDNLTGHGEGDDETISVDLDRLAPNVQHLVFVVNSFSGHNFRDVQRAFCRLFNGRTQHELARFDLTGGESATAMLMARLTRREGGWDMTALGTKAGGQTARGSIKDAQQELRSAGV